MRIREEKIDFNEIVKQFVKEMSKPTDIDFLIEAEDPVRELLKYGVYHLGANNYRECIEEIANNQFAYNALLEYIKATYGKSTFMSITIDDWRTPHGYIRSVREPADANYIWPNNIRNGPIKDIFLDVLKSAGWWTNDNNSSLYSDEFSEKFVSKLELEFR